MYFVLQNSNTAFANLNLGAVGLAALITLGGVWLGGAAKILGNKMYPPLKKTGKVEGK